MTTNNDLYTAWLKEGNEPTVLPMKETATHSLRTKSHMKGGKYSYYNIGGTMYWPQWIDTEDDDTLIPVVLRPQDVKIVVAGGEVGGYSSIVFCYGMPATTRPIPSV